MRVGLLRPVRPYRWACRPWIVTDGSGKHPPIGLLMRVPAGRSACKAFGLVFGAMCVASVSVWALAATRPATASPGLTNLTPSVSEAT